MIPRVKVNYHFKDLLRASFSRETSNSSRNFVISQLENVFNTPNILLTASGRGALYALLSSLPHSKVVLPAYTCKAVVEATLLAGKKPVFVEIQPDRFNISTKLLGALLDKNTIIIATHQFGIPCEIHKIVEMAHDSGSFVIEDCAASLGSKVNGVLTGSFGDAAFFSFDSTKLISTPLKGGCLTIKNSKLLQNCKIFLDTHTRPMSTSRKFYLLTLGLILLTLKHPGIYYCFHKFKFQWRNRFTDDTQQLNLNLDCFYTNQLAEWQATILIPQLKNLDRLIKTRQYLYSSYLLALGEVKSIILPPHDSQSEWAPIRFPIRVIGNKMEFYYESIKRGVDYAFSFTFIASPSEYFKSHKLANSILDLPFYDQLSQQELLHVTNTIKDLDPTIKKGE